MAARPADTLGRSSTWSVRGLKTRPQLGRLPTVCFLLKIGKSSLSTNAAIAGWGNEAYEMRTPPSPWQPQGPLWFALIWRWLVGMSAWG